MNRTIVNTSGEVEIWLVEANPNDAELTQRALKKYNLANRIVWMKDSEAALDFIFGSSNEYTTSLKHKPGIVLLDLKLTKIDGHEVLRRLKEDPRTCTIPIVVLTSSREEVDMVRSYELGVNSYIVKPVEFDKFVEAVRELGLYWLLLNRQPQKGYSGMEAE